jgi:hypothetical protein
VSIAVVLVWLLIIFVITGPLLRWPSRNGLDNNQNGDNSNNGEMILARLSRAMTELTALKAQNEELRSLLQNYLPIDVNSIDHLSSPLIVNSDINSNNNNKDNNNNINAIEVQKTSHFPSQEYELTRRRIVSNVNELWHFLRTKTNSTIMQFVNEIRHNLLYELGLDLLFSHSLQLLNIFYFV